MSPEDPIEVANSLGARLTVAAKDGTAALRDHLAAGTLSSDHAPLVEVVAGLGTLVSYNIMARMRAEDGRVNNGFGASESQEAYEARLRRIAASLGDFARRGAVAFLLQEAPAEGRLIATLQETLPRDWRALSMPTRAERFAQVVLYSVVTLRARPLAEPAGLGPQSGRVQLVELGREGGVPVTVANVHLKWGLPCDAAMRVLAGIEGRLVVAGDFNRSPADVVLPGARCAVPERPTAVAHTEAGPRLTNVDGFLVRG